jgi:hypothetical protein
LTAKIARKWCVNLEWLATGNGDMLSPGLGSEFSSEEKTLIEHYRKVRQIISACAGCGKVSVSRESILAD